MQEMIKDPYGKLLGFIETRINGDKIIKDNYGKPLGYYRKAQNITTDIYNKIIAKGDVLSSLLFKR